MDVESFRDWIIIILGILEIVLILGVFIMVLVIYQKVNRLIAQGKETVMKIQNTFAAPYFKAASWIFKALAAGIGMFQKRNTKEEN